MNRTCAGFPQVSDPLELGLQAVVSSSVGTGSQTWVFWMSSQFHPLNPVSHTSVFFLRKEVLVNF